MEALGNLGISLTRLLDGVADTSDWLLLSVMFAAILLATLGALTLFGPADAVRRRITAQGPGQPGKEKKLSLRRNESRTPLHKILETLEQHVIKTNDKERSVLRTRMIQAGYMNETVIRVYYLVRVFLAVSLPVIFLLLAPIFASQMSTQKVMMIAAGLCLAGLYLPYRYIESKTVARRREISESFPDAIDMMVVCVEAGLGFDATLLRVSEQIQRSHPILATLIGFVGLETRAGKTREEALQNLAMRAGVPDVNNFIILLIQSEALGADLSHTLKVQAVEMRSKRMMRAEEQAHKLPVKLSIPLVLCVLPAMFAVVLGPAIVTIVRDVLPALNK
jgi:tight adherence protein C